MPVAGSSFSRTVAFLLLFGIIGFTVFAIIAPLRETYSKNEAKLASIRTNTLKLTQASKRFPVLEAHLKELRANNPQRKHFMRAAKQQQALTELQSTVGRFVREVRGRVLSASGVRTTAVESFDSVVLRADVRIDPKGLTQLLHRIESQTPKLFIDNVSIEPAQSSARRSRNANRQNQAQQLLKVRFDITGYLWRERG